MARKRLTIEKNSQRVWKKIVSVRNRKKKRKNEKEIEGILWIYSLRDHNVRKGKRPTNEDDYIYRYIYIYYIQEVAIGLVGFFIYLFF